MFRALILIPEVSRGGPIRGERKFCYVADGREEGLYLQELALVALSKSIDLADLQIRSEDDPPGETFIAEFEPLIRDEYNRRNLLDSPKWLLFPTTVLWNCFRTSDYL